MSDETKPENQTETPAPANDSAADTPELAPDEIVAALQAELSAAKDQILRALADAENTRKRAERQIAEAKAFAIDRFARDLLGVSDNLARAIATISADVRAGLSGEALALLEGVELTEKALISNFERHGLKQINEAGSQFDPNVHEAVAQIPSPEAAGKVAQIFQPGWRLGERTLRPAMVAVSLGPVGGAQPAGEAQAQSAEPGSIVDQQA